MNQTSSNVRDTSRNIAGKGTLKDRQMEYDDNASTVSGSSFRTSSTTSGGRRRRSELEMLSEDLTDAMSTFAQDIIQEEEANHREGRCVHCRVQPISQFMGQSQALQQSGHRHSHRSRGGLLLDVSLCPAMKLAQSGACMNNRVHEMMHKGLHHMHDIVMMHQHHGGIRRDKLADDDTGSVMSAESYEEDDRRGRSSGGGSRGGGYVDSSGRLRDSRGKFLPMDSRGAAMARDHDLDEDMLDNLEGSISEPEEDEDDDTMSVTSDIVQRVAWMEKRGMGRASLYRPTMRKIAERVYSSFPETRGSKYYGTYREGQGGGERGGSQGRSQAAQDRERDERGRFVSEDDDAGSVGSAGSRGKSRGRGSSSRSRRGREIASRLDRDERGRFVSEDDDSSSVGGGRGMELAHRAAEEVSGRRSSSKRRGSSSSSSSRREKLFRTLKEEAARFERAVSRMKEDDELSSMSSLDEQNRMKSSSSRSRSKGRHMASAMKTSSSKMRRLMPSSSRSTSASSARGQSSRSNRGKSAQNLERDERGRFISEDDSRSVSSSGSRTRGGRSSRGGGNRQRTSSSNRGKSAQNLERDERGRFISEDDSRSVSDSGSPTNKNRSRRGSASDDADRDKMKSRSSSSTQSRPRDPETGQFLSDDEDRGMNKRQNEKQESSNRAGRRSSGASSSRGQRMSRTERMLMEMREEAERFKDGVESLAGSQDEEERSVVSSVVEKRGRSSRGGTSSGRQGSGGGRGQSSSGREPLSLKPARVSSSRREEASTEYDEDSVVGSDVTEERGRRGNMIHAY